MHIMKAYRKLLAQVRDKDLATLVDNENPTVYDRDRRQQEMAAITSLFGGAQVFVTEDLVQIEELDDNSMFSSSNAMLEAGVWGLPFDRCVFLCPHEGGTFLMAVGAAVVPKEDGPDIVYVHPFLYNEVQGRWGTIPVFSFMDITPDLPCAGATFYDNVGEEDVSPELSKVWAELLNLAMRIVDRNVVLIATTGVSVERVHTKGTKPRYRDDPEYTYHKLVVPGVLGCGEARGPVGERRRVRLHLRRGFVRQNQPVGPGRAERRPVWVRPTLVGYQEEGGVFKDYVVASPANT